MLSACAGNGTAEQATEAGTTDTVAEVTTDTGGEGGDKTYEGDGYSFSYPGDWDEGTARQVASGSSEVVVSPTGSGESFVSTAVAHDVFPGPVTQANFDDEFPLDLVRSELSKAMEPRGNVLEGDPVRVSHAGLLGLEFRASSTGRDPEIHYRNIWLFDGRTQYVINCQFTDARAEEVGQGCDLVLSSFQLSD